MSSFVKHPICKDGCQNIRNIGECRAVCVRLEVDEIITQMANDRRPIFEVRDTDDQARVDRKARARECK